MRLTDYTNFLQLSYFSAKDMVKKKKIQRGVLVLEKMPSFLFLELIPSYIRLKRTKDLVLLAQHSWKIV